MASKAPLGPVFGLIASCSRVRRVQLPARAFQLRCRPDVETRQGRHLHSTPSRPRRHRLPTPGTTNTITESSPPAATDSSTRTTTSFSKPTSTHPFREYMRQVTHPVAIITSTDTSISHSSSDPTTWRGATVSSFNSVTLDPSPHVSFNIKRLSSTYDAMRHSGLFAVHLMSGTPEAAEIASRFARGNESAPFLVDAGSEETHEFVKGTPEWYADLDVPGSPASLPPTIQWSHPRSRRAVLFQALCEFLPEKTIEVGDHVVVVGRVLGVYGNLRAGDERAQFGVALGVPRYCLTYSHGEYGGVPVGLDQMGEVEERTHSLGKDEIVSGTKKEAIRRNFDEEQGGLDSKPCMRTRVVP